MSFLIILSFRDKWTYTSLTLKSFLLKMETMSNVNDSTELFLIIEII